MKKISLVLLIIVLFNFIFCNFVYAEPNTTNTSTNTAPSFNVSSMYQADQEGTVEINGYTKEINVTQSVVGAVLGILISPVVLITETVSGLLNVISVECGYYHTDSDFGADKDKTIKVSSIIFGEFLLFDAGITKTTSNLNSTIIPSKLGEVFDSIKETGVAIFEIIRAIAIGIFLVLILVTAIRLSVSDVAEDRAKLKGLIGDWFIGLIFTLCVKYLILLCGILIDSVMESIWLLRLTLEEGNFRSFEFSIYENIFQVLIESGGMQFFAYSILYILLSLITFKFFFKYVYRVFKVLFLVIISPIVGVIYTLQRAGEKGENAIANWFSTYLITLSIQPIHAIIYLIFMFSASEIAINAPFLGIAFLWMLERSEKVIQAIFRLNDKVTIVEK